MSKRFCAQMLSFHNINQKMLARLFVFFAAVVALASGVYLQRENQAKVS